MDDTLLKSRGECRPVLNVGSGEHRQDVTVTFQVVEGITDNILSVNRAVDAGATVVFSPDECYIQWADGGKAGFHRQGKQFILPYEELTGKPSRQVKIAPVIDEEAAAVEAYAALDRPDSDEEMYEPSIAAEDEEGPEGDLESEVTDPVPPSAGGPAVPAEPTAAERAAHALTHLPFQPWCDDCVSGKSKESPHRRRSAEEEVSVERLPVVQIDYMFLGRECDELPEESALLTFLVAVDVESGYPFAMQVPRKGMEHGKYALENLDLFLNRLGYDKVILQHDAEHAVGAVAKALQRHLGSARVRVRSAPVKSHQSQGSVESANAFLAGQIRTLWASMKQRYPELEPTHNVMPWLIRHASWLIARYHVRTRDKLTPYRITQGVDYTKLICQYGEVVMGKVPVVESKLSRKWLKGIWLGKLERDDSNIIGTSAGAIAVRSVRRLPKESQIDAAILEEMRGLPWRPRDGHRKARRETSEVAVVPAPLLAHPAPEDAGDTALPVTAEDGARPDEEALLVEAAAQIEELEFVDPPPGAEHPPALPTGSLKRGAEDILDQPATPPPSPRSPVSPKREAPPAPEPAEAPKAPRIAGITALEVWKAVQDWGESQESSNPFAQQRISNIADYVDQLLDPELVHVARKEQLKKVWDRYAFTPVLKEEVPKGAQVFGHKWVDKNSRGKYKSRFTCADGKARHTKEQEAEMNVFVPTPTAESHAFLEVYALLNGYMTRSLDIVAAFLIGEDRGASEGNWVYVRAPVEWYELFQEWLATLPPADRSRYQHRFRDVLFRLDGNLYMWEKDRRIGLPGRA